jgi:hypothetical protein
MVSAPARLGPAATVTCYHLDAIGSMRALTDGGSGSVWEVAA